MPLFSSIVFSLTVNLTKAPIINLKRGSSSKAASFFTQKEAVSNRFVYKQHTSCFALRVEFKASWDYAISFGIEQITYICRPISQKESL
jgi:hypothetical protein